MRKIKEVLRLRYGFGLSERDIARFDGAANDHWELWNTYQIYSFFGVSWGSYKT
jgi:hypothetical protein